MLQNRTIITYRPCSFPFLSFLVVVAAAVRLFIAFKKGGGGGKCNVTMAASTAVATVIIFVNFLNDKSFLDSRTMEVHRTEYTLRPKSL